MAEKLKTGVGHESRSERVAHESHLRRLIYASGQLADACEHIEHLEQPHYRVASVSRCLIEISVAMAADLNRDLRQAYIDRIFAVESDSYHRLEADSRINLAGYDKLVEAQTWRQIQIGQIYHDRRFHPDVFGLSRREQLRHYSFHVSKLPWRLAEAIDANRPDDFYDVRLADVALFGVKLASLIDWKLPQTPVDQGFVPA